MVPRALKIMKAIIRDNPGVTEDMKKQLKHIDNCRELHSLIRRDFWVTTPCHSISRPGIILEGTRLTIQYVPPEGYEFSIRTPGTPPRWKEYENEMDYVYKLLVAEVTADVLDLDKVSEWILTLTFYWYNFMPLSRGTAAVGFICLLGMFLAIGIEISQQVPKGQQVDWEGILGPKPQDFIDSLKPWLYPARKATEVLNTLPSVSKTFPTIRSRIQAMNAK